MVSLHREDGPAVVNPDGSVSWFIQGMWFGNDLSGPRLQHG